MKLATALALFPLVLGAVEVELDFTITSTIAKPSEAVATYEIGTDFNNPSTIETYTTPLLYTGNLVMTAEIDSSTGDMDSFEFTGGSIDTPNLSAALTPKIGSVPWSAFFTTNGIKRSPRSSAEDPLTGGAPNGNYHYSIFTEGSLTVTNYPSGLPNSFVTYTAQLAEDPPYLIGADIIFPVSIDINETTSTSLSHGYVASLHSFISLGPANFPWSYIKVGGSASSFFKHRYTETGNIYASTSYSVPTDYGQWALDNDLDLTTGEESNAAGLPYALIYAFDLPTDAASLPLTFISTPEPTVELDLPSSGLGFTVHVEYSPDLTSGFSPLPDENFEDGTDSLDAGKFRTVTLSYPGGEQGYLRFRVDL
jgi:hypothetical protein